MRSLVAEPGMKGWVKEVTGFHLPSGLANHPEVTVTRGAENERVLVTDSAGRDFELPEWLLDVGKELNIGGEFVHESHPEAINVIRGALKGFDREPPVPGTRRAEARDLCLRILKRNGHGV